MSGNLVAPPGDGGGDVAADAVIDQVSGNLAPPPDAGPDANDASPSDAANDTKGD